MVVNEIAPFNKAVNPTTRNLLDWDEAVEAATSVEHMLELDTAMQFDARTVQTSPSLQEMEE